MVYALYQRELKEERKVDTHDPNVKGESFTKRGKEIQVCSSSLGFLCLNTSRILRRWLPRPVIHLRLWRKLVEIPKSSWTLSNHILSLAHEGREVPLCGFIRFHPSALRTGGSGVTHTYLHSPKYYLRILLLKHTGIGQDNASWRLVATAALAVPGIKCKWFLASSRQAIGIWIRWARDRWVLENRRHAGLDRSSNKNNCRLIEATGMFTVTPKSRKCHDSAIICQREAKMI